MNKILLFIALLVIPALAGAQQKTEVIIPFNGLVINSAGKGLKVNVSVKHSDKHTVADKRGKFGLTNIAVTDTLVLKYKGSQIEVPLEGRRSLKVLWDEEGPAYDESKDLVDSGFGYVSRREYTDSSTGFSGEMMIQRGFTDLQSAIVNLVPNIQLVNGMLTIRGVASINSPTPALIICDGSPLNNINTINIRDVKSVEVQRGNNMYGLRGGNGVIIIRTRNK